MIIQIMPTDNLAEIDNVPVRLWDGITEAGIQCKVFVHRIAVHMDCDSSQFDKELIEKLPGGRKISLRYLL